MAKALGYGRRADAPARLKRRHDPRSPPIDRLRPDGYHASVERCSPAWGFAPMLRRAVAIYMAFVLTAGQSFCCCSAASLAAHSSPAVVAGAAERPIPPARSCCCPERSATAVGMTTEGERPGAAGDQQPGKPPGKHQCPCQGKDKPTATAGETTAAPVAAPQMARLLVVVLEFVVTFRHVCVDPVPPDAGGRTSPPGHRLVARQLLDLHHQLRC